MIFRTVEGAEMPQVENLWDYCFEKKDDPFFKYYFTRYAGKHNTIIGGFEDNGAGEVLRTMLHINPYMLNIRGTQQLTPYLVGIATAPEARGRRCMQGLMKKTLETLLSKGCAFATLMPIYAGIYLPYEFSFCYFKQSYSWETGSLGLKLSVGNDADFETEHMSIAGQDALYDTAAAKRLAALYVKYTEVYNGVPLRTPEQWDKLLSVHVAENVQAAFVRCGKEDAGYMLYKIEAGAFYILELLAENAPAKVSLLKYADRHRSEAKRVEWLAEAWDKTYLAMQDAALAPKLKPFMMSRCINAKLALEQLSMSKDSIGLGGGGELVLRLTDNILESNNQLLKLSLADGRLKISETQETVQVTMDMGAFTQMFMGAFTASELCEAGRINCADAAALKLLDEILPKTRNWINEYF